MGSTIDGGYLLLLPSKEPAVRDPQPAQVPAAGAGGAPELTAPVVKDVFEEPSPPLAAAARTGARDSDEASAASLALRRPLGLEGTPTDEVRALVDHLRGRLALGVHFVAWECEETSRLMARAFGSLATSQDVEQLSTTLVEFAKHAPGDASWLGRAARQQAEDALGVRGADAVLAEFLASDRAENEPDRALAQFLRTALAEEGRLSRGHYEVASGLLRRAYLTTADQDELKGWVFECARQAPGEGSRFLANEAQMLA